MKYKNGIFEQIRWLPCDGTVMNVPWEISFQNENETTKIIAVSDEQFHFIVEEKLDKLAISLVDIRKITW